LCFQRPLRANGSWIYSYPCNKRLSPLKLRVQILLMARCSRCNITLYVINVGLWLATGRWFSSGTTVSYTNKIDHHDTTESGVRHHNPSPNPLFCFPMFWLWQYLQVIQERRRAVKIWYLHFYVLILRFNKKNYLTY
jgi:hypothetical protein